MKRNHLIRRSIQWLPLAAIMSAISIGGLASNACSQTNRDRGQSSTTVDSAANEDARQRPDDFIVVSSATVRFASQTQVPATRSGRVMTISATEHQPIGRGQTILKLDDSTLMLSRSAAKLKLVAAQRRANNVIHQQFAELSLGEAEDEWESSRAVQREAQGAISSNQMRRLRVAVQQARLNVAEAKDQQIEAQTEAQIVAAQLDVIDAEIADTTITSPGAGVVIDMPHRRGEWVQAGETVAVIAEIERLRVDALVSATQLDQDRCVGLPVVAMWSDPITGQQKQLGGKIESSDLQNLPGQRYRVHAILDNVRVGEDDRWLLKPGIDVTLRIQSGQQPDWRLGSIRHRTNQ